MKKVLINEEIWKEGNMIVAYCPELDIPATGKTIEEAKKNLIDVIKINFEEMNKMGTLNQYLDERGFIIQNDLISSSKKILEFCPLELKVEAI